MSIKVKTSPKKSNQKTEQLLLYIADKMQAEKGYGAVLLNKILYYIDNVCYLETGKPISQFKYVRQNQGATPMPKVFLSLRQSMIERGIVEEKQVEYFGRIQKKLMPLKSAQINVFTSTEIALMDKIIDLLKDANATIISNFNHKELCWQIAEPMEELPFFTYLLTKADIDDSDIKWAKESIRTYEMRNN